MQQKLKAHLIRAESCDLFLQIVVAIIDQLLLLLLGVDQQRVVDVVWQDCRRMRCSMCAINLWHPPKYADIYTHVHTHIVLFVYVLCFYQNNLNVAMWRAINNMYLTCVVAAVLTYFSSFLGELRSSLTLRYVLLDG